MAGDEIKVLFINPPFQRLKGMAQVYLPLGLGYLCSYLSRDRKINAMIYNAETPDLAEKTILHAKYQDMLNLHDKYVIALKDDGHYVWEEARRVIRDFRPDVVCVTVMTAKYGAALKISRIAKTANSGCRVVWGGQHATIDYERVLKEPLVDFVVRGEGEVTLKSLVDLIAAGKDADQGSLSSIESLSYKIGSNAFHNPRRELIEDLDSLPFPARDKLLFKERYLPSSWGDIITLRGCPFRCGYCSAHNIWTRKTRYRALDNVMEEIKAVIEKNHTTEFNFCDDSFTLNRGRALELCALLKKLKPHITWWCTTRVDLLDDHLVKEMKAAGCTSVSIGVESGSPRMLDNIQKDITIEKVRNAAALLDKHKLKYEAYFLIGFPEETKEDVEETFGLMKRLKRGRVCFSIFTPYPGTEQYNIAKRHNLIPLNPDWSRFSHQSRENHFAKNLSREELDYYVETISTWVDDNNSRNTSISTLFWKAFLNFGSLVRRPGLIIGKWKTLKTLLNNKIKAYRKAGIRR